MEGKHSSVVWDNIKKYTRQMATLDPMFQLLIWKIKFKNSNSVKMLSEIPGTMTLAKKGLKKAQTTNLSRTKSARTNP